MKPSLIDEFILFSKYLSFTETAKALGITEPTLSKHMQQLESALEIKLIARRRKNALTPAGDYFLRNIYALNERYETIVENCQKLQDSPQEIKGRQS